MAHRNPTTRYQGAVADNYERVRSGKAKWQREQTLLAELLQEIGVGPGSVVLDVPVGTGRFLPLYRSLGCRIVGLDLSSDMLRHAEERALAVGLEDASLRQGNITAIDLPDNSIDVAVCVRFGHLVDLSTFTQALAELTRVSRKSVLVTVPIWNPLLGAGLRESAMRLLARVRQRLVRLARGRLKGVRRHPEVAVRAAFARLGLTVARQDVLERRKLNTHWMFTLVPPPQGDAPAAPVP